MKRATFRSECGYIGRVIIKYPVFLFFKVRFGEIIPHTLHMNDEPTDFPFYIYLAGKIDKYFISITFTIHFFKERWVKTSFF